MNHVEAYPLHWPPHVPRTPAQKRQRARFATGTGWKERKQLSVAKGRDRLLAELDRYTKHGHTHRVPPGSIIISTNVRTRKDGLPYSNAAEPDDPGVCVYFELDGMPIALPCDTFDRVADNLAAIAGHIDADRRQERYGVGRSADRYAGFKALPQQGSGRPWWDVLGLDRNASQEDVKRAYRQEAKRRHPDAGGNPAQWDELQDAYSQALAATASGVTT